jgi:uncharacterized repeat protein (TIGR01451 family)
MRKYLLLIVAAALLYPGVASAQTNCQPLYGGGETCVQAPNISINKLVKHPNENRFVDNLGVNDPKFGPDSTVNFRLEVKNTSNNALTNIRVRDIFPQQITFVKGFQGGSFDNASRTYTINIDRLERGQSRVFDIEAKTVSVNQFPTQSISCIVNQGQVTQGNSTSQDNAQFCIQRETLSAQLTPAQGQPQQQGTPGTTKGGQPQPGTTKGGQPIYPQPQTQAVPKTGPEAIALAALLPSSLAGILLRKKAK